MRKMKDENKTDKEKWRKKGEKGNKSKRPCPWNRTGKVPPA